MIFVEDKFEFQSFLIEYRKHTNLIYVRLSDDEKHVMNNRISFIYVKSKKYEWVINVNNGDGLGIKVEALGQLLNTIHPQLIFNYKAISQILNFTKGFDVDLAKFIEYGYHDIELGDNGLNQFYKSKFKGEPFLNDSIPMVKQIELIQQYVSKFSLNVNKNSIKYIDDVTKAFGYIESSGLKIDGDYVLNYNPVHLTKDNMVYTQYNLMTSTLRPSNRYGGVNYAALKKDTGERKAFISRFDGGELISCDYEAYHPRLLMDIIYQMKLNSNADVKEMQWIKDFYGSGLDFYTWIGNQIGIEDRNEVKTLIFQNLYGGIRNELLEIKYFKEIQHLTNLLSETIVKNKAIFTHSYHIQFGIERLEPITPAKVLNYYIQAYETERNIKKILKIKEKLEGKHTKLILYTYDAFVFDVYPSEKQYLYTDIIPILKGGYGRYQVKTTTGKNYDEL
jgi:DNA-directed RNA polymerase subunit L